MEAFARVRLHLDVMRIADGSDGSEEEENIEEEGHLWCCDSRSLKQLLEIEVVQVEGGRMHIGCPHAALGQRADQMRLGMRLLRNEQRWCQIHVVYET